MDDRKNSMNWGEIDWVYMPEEGSADNMRIGISRMKPGAVQPRHTHYGDEQFHYILSGHGRQRVGNEESLIEPGKLFHISAGMEHETESFGDEPLVKILVSVPAVTSTPTVSVADPERPNSMEFSDKREFLKSTVNELYKAMLASLKVPVTIYDADQKLVYQSPEYPQRCCENCHIDKNIENCARLAEKENWTPPAYGGASASECDYGMLIYALPIVADGELLGFIKTGHVNTRPSEDSSLYNAPESTVKGIIEVARRICEAIVNHYRVCSMQTSLQGQMLNLRVNRHFLFNTLNTIAAMAIREGAFETYEAVGNLSRLLNYTQSVNELFVPLSRELEYVKNYTLLQRLRFGNNLELIYDIEDGLEGKVVPFNFLQPIVENCFKHAFKDKEGIKKLEISLKTDDGFLVFCVKDNGIGISADRLELINERIQSGGPEHGTAMVASKLRMLYGNAFSYTVENIAEGTMVTVRIPL